jgi:TonB-linked SusC/RagA family outer membrane protein
MRTHFVSDDLGGSMRQIILRGALLCLWFVGVLSVALVPVLAQSTQGEIRGTVKDRADDPLIGANVIIEGTNRGAATNSEGAYVVRDLPPGQYKVIVRFLGYRTSQETVTLTAGQTVELNFTLDEDILKIDEVVVTGLSGEIPRAQLGNSIAKLSGSELAKAPVTSVMDALAGKVAGMRVTKAAGTPGAGTYITLRGRKSVTGSSEPLYVIDGVPIDNSYIYWASGQQQQANRASDINPNDIESIEVLKGASAAAIYGARAANGVVLITTKTGKLSEVGKLARISYTSSYTSDDVATFLPMQTTYGQRIPYNDQTGTAGSSDSWGAALPAGASTYDHSKDVFRTGHMMENTLAISGGSPTFRYLASGTFTDQAGVIRNSNYMRQNVRLNLNYVPFNSLGIRSNSNFINQAVDLPQDGSNVAGILLGSLRTPPEFNNQVFLRPDGTTQRRFASYDNPFWTVEFNKFKTELTRFIHSTGFDFDFYEGMRLSGNVGWDRYNQFDSRRLFNGSAGSAPANRGSIDQYRRTNDVVNTDLMLTGKYQFTSDLLGTLILGQQLTFFTDNYTRGSSNTTLPFFDEVGSGVNKDASSSRSESRIYSYYVQGMVNAWDRVTVTGGVRRDAGSTFGKSSPVHYYPKASIAYRLSQESFMQDMKGYVDELKLRAAWGQAGRTPGVYSTNYLYVTGGFFDPWGRTTSAQRSGQLGIRHDIGAGNNEIKPELSTELELGLDAAFWDRRVNLEFNYYRQDISELLLYVDVPTSTGYDSQYRNAGEMWNRGIEVKLDINPIRWDDFSWIASFNYAQNKNEVTKLEGFENSYVTIGGAFQGHYNIAKQGRPLGTWLGNGYQRDAAGNMVYTDPADPNRQDNFLGLDIKGAPMLSEEFVELGKADPDWIGSIRNDFSFLQGDLNISVLFDIAQGFKVYNGTRGAMYNFGTHGDTKDREALWFNESGQPVIYQGTTPSNLGLAGGRTYQPGEQLRKEVYYRVYGNGFAYQMTEASVEDGSYVKLRDVSVSYRFRNIPFFNIESIVLTASGRNLKTWTDYTGYDPEVNTFQSAEGRGFDYFTLPQIRSFRFELAINY